MSYKFLRALQLVLNRELWEFEIARTMHWSQPNGNGSEHRCLFCLNEMVDGEWVAKIKWNGDPKDFHFRTLSFRVPFTLGKRTSALWVHNNCWEDPYLSHRKLLDSEQVESGDLVPLVDPAKAEAPSIMDEETLADLICPDAGGSSESKYFDFSDD